MKSTLFSDVKRFMMYILRRSYAIQAILLILFVIFAVYQIQVNQVILNRVDKVERKVDFRYFNLTRSIEEIHAVEIDTKDGRVRK